MKNAFQYIIISIVSLASFYAFIYVPWASETKITSERIIVTSQELRDFNTTIELFPEIMASHDELADLQKRLQSRLYAKDDIIDLFNHLRDEALKLGLAVNEICPPVEELLRLNSISLTEGEAEFLNVRVNLLGDYINLSRFIKKVEESSFFRGIGFCEFTSSGDPVMSTSMNLEFRALLGDLKGQS